MEHQQAMAQRTAAWLNRDPDRPRGFVAILASRSVEAYVGVLGTGWAGDAYVPINPKLPEDRIATLLQIIQPVDCERRLREEVVGRIGVTVEGHPEIFPINYAVDDAGGIVFRTDPGAKLLALVDNATVAFEVDTPARTPRPRGSPVTLIMPLSAWTMRSSAARSR